MTKQTFGMLWSYDIKADFREELEKAATYYKNKYGVDPVICSVSELDIKESMMVGNIQVVPKRSTQQAHMWLSGGKWLTKEEKVAKNV